MPLIDRTRPVRRPVFAAVAAVAVGAFMAACGAAAPTPSPSASPSAAAPTPVVTAVPPSPTAAASASAEAARPRAPRGVEFKDKVDESGSMVMDRYTVRWASPLDPGTTIRVFGIEGCPVEESDEPEPCVTRRTDLPADMRTLIAKAPAEDGILRWEWPHADMTGSMALAWDGEHGFYAFVMRATNAAGASRFVVLDSAETCPDCGF